MSAPPLRIGLFGLFGVRNLGNEASLAATVAGLRARAPQAELVLVSSPPPDDAGLPAFNRQIEPDLLPVQRFGRFVPTRFRRAWLAFMQRVTEPLRRRRTRRAARSLDVLLIAGTGIADDLGQGPYDAPHHLARWCGVMRELGRPARFASVGAGPVSDPLSRRWFADAFRAADYRSYREVSSREFALEIDGGSAADRVAPDLVFSLDAPRGLAAPRWPPRSVALGVMGYKGWNVEGAAGEAIYAAYLAKLTWLAGALLDAGLQVRLLIGNRGGDRRPIADLRKALAQHPHADALVSADIRTHGDVLREIAASDLVIATRFHNVLKALLLGRPVISIGYARKNDDLMREMGLAAYCHGVETFDPAVVFAQLQGLAAQAAPPVETVHQRVTEYRQALASQFDRLLAPGLSSEG